MYLTSKCWALSNRNGYKCLNTLIIKATFSLKAYTPKSYIIYQQKYLWKNIVEVSLYEGLASPYKIVWVTSGKR